MPSPTRSESVVSDAFRAPVLDLYLDYRQLTARHSAELMACVDDIFRQLSLSPDGGAPASMLALPGAQKDPQSLAHLFGANQLQVFEIHTGDSITFRFTAGYMPRVSVRDKDAVVELPKAAAAIIVLAHLLQSAAGVANTVLDTAIKAQQVYAVAQTAPLQNEKLQLEIYELRHKIYGASAEQQRQLRQSLDEFRRLSVEHPEVRQVHVRVDELR